MLSYRISLVRCRSGWRFVRMYPFLCSSIWSLGVDQTVCRTHLANLKPLIENGTIVAGGWFSLFFFSWTSCCVF